MGDGKHAYLDVHGDVCGMGTLYAAVNPDHAARILGWDSSAELPEECSGARRVRVRHRQAAAM